MKTNVLTRSQFVAGRLREVLLDGHWIANTNFREQIHDLTWQQANHKVGDLNTIAALIYHINYYLSGVLPVFGGGTLDIRDKYSFDLPPITSQADWQHLIDDFLANAEKLALQVETMPDQQLDEVFADEKYGNFLRNMEGMIEHSYYHLGQISLIKKMITAHQ